MGMPETSGATHKDNPKRPIMARLASWARDWKPFIKRVLRHSILQFPSCLAISSLAVLVLAPLLYVSLRSSELREKLWGWIEELTVTTFIAVVILFAVSLILVFIFSIYPRTRRIASKLSTFVEEPEVEKLKERVDAMGNELDSIHKRLDGLDGKTDTTNKALAEVRNDLDNIEHRLESIQNTLKTFVNRENRENKDD